MTGGNEKRFIRIKEVINLTGVPRSTIYLKMKQGEFPKNIKLGQRSTAWMKSEIDEWMQTCVEQRNDFLKVS